MLMLELALAALLTTTTEPPVKPPTPSFLSAPLGIGGADLAQLIKKDIESIAGPGAVDISIDHETLFSVRVAVPGFSAQTCAPIYDIELKLYRFFPDLNFDFYLRPKPAPAENPSR